MLRSRSRVARFRATSVAIILVAAVGITLSGCATGDEPGAAPTDTPLPTEIPPGTTLVIADQQERFQTALRASGELDKLPFEVEFANFIGGPEILEAFRAGAADVAPAGDVPPIHALAARQDVPIIAAYQTDPLGIKLAVAPGVTATTLADLKGKKIAYAEGTAQQAAILRALDRAGLTTADVELVRLQLAEFNDAVRTGQVDIAPLNEPRLTRFLRTPGAGVIPDSEARDIYYGLGYLYARRAATQDPAKGAALRALVAAFVRSFHWTNTHRDEWARIYYIENQKLGADDAGRIVDSLGEFNFPHLDQKLIDRQQETIDVIDAAGQLPRRVEAADGFDLRFDEVITQTVTAVGARFDREEQR